MKLKRFACGALAAVMSFSLLAGPGGFVIPARAARTNTLGDGLVLYSTFDDSDRDGTTVKDLSGNGHDGTAVGSLEFVTGKDGGQAIKITGQTTAGEDKIVGDRYVDYGKSVDIIPSTGNFSISLWYQAGDAPQSNAALLCSKAYRSGANAGFVLGYVNGPNHCANIGFGGTRNEVKLDSTTTSGINDKNWHHLAVTVDRGGKLTYYVDTQVVGDVATTNPGSSIDAGLNLVLGAGGDFCNAANDCLLDDLLIYDRVITSAEIALLYAKTAPDLTPLGLDEGIILDVDFNDSTAADQSGNSYDGTVTGSGVTFVDGPFGKAVRIHNTSTSTTDSYISFGSNVTQAMGTDPFTLSLWYKADGAINNWGNFISNKDYASGKNAGLNLCVESMELGGIMSVVHKNDNWYEVKRFDMKQNDGGWHHIVATAVPGGNLNVYVDGELVGTAALASGTIHTGNPLILGADGTLKYPVQNLLVDELRIYGRALTATDVQALYGENSAAADAANAPITLTKLRAAVEAVQTGVVCTAEDQQALLGKIDALLDELEGGSLGTSEINSRMAELEAEYQAFLNGKTPLASFHLISDVHIKGASQTETNTVNYITAMENMKTLNADTTIAFVNAGDNTQNGQSAEVEGFYTATAAHNPVSDEETLILLGNHDVRGLAGTDQVNWNRDPNAPEKCVYWQTAKGLYITNNEPYMPESAKTTLYHSKELGGYTFLMLNTELGLKDAMYMSDEQLAWFEAEMRKAYEADPNKPVFIISHQALNDTHWLSNLLDGFDGVKADGSGQTYQTGKDAAVKAIMEKYPVGIFLSGHIHNGFGVASVIPRSYGVNVDIPSFNDSDNGVKDKGIGYEVMIYNGYVAFRARNFITEEWLPEYDVVIPVGEKSYPELIQKLEPVMDGLEWYSEGDAAELEAAFGDFWNLVDRYYDQSAASWDSYNPTNGIVLFGPDEQEAIASAAAEAWENINLLDEVTKLDSPRKTVYEQMRENWRAYLLGGSGDDLNLDDPAIAAYVKGLNTEANRYWNSLVKDDPYNGIVFPDLDMTSAVTNATTRSGNMGTTLRRLVTMSMAWSTKGCDLYHDEWVLEEIIKATDYMVENHFSKKYTKSNTYGNWYHWDITCPTALGNIAMILYDELGADRVQLYAETVQHFAPACDVVGPNSPGNTAMTGGNLLLKANGVAQAGILLEDATMLENVRSKVKETVSTYNDPDALFACDSTGDGFYADGSYIQHQALPYIAGYGADLYNNFSVFGRLLKGTPWEIKYEDGETPLIFNFVFDGIEPFIVGSRTMDMVASRDITRSSRTDKVRTADLLKALLGMRGAFPTAEQNQRFDEMMKYYLSQNLDFYYSNIDSITAIQAANELMNDDSISPRSSYQLTKVFAMDRAVHYTGGFALGIAMQSTRTFAHEIINDEGKRTWNIANGMVFLYDEDEDQYGGGYWCTVDPTRLPGITAEHVVLANGRGSLNANIYDWTGGSVLEDNGVAGMYMKALSRNDTPSSYRSGPRTGADMKKSWFMFGDRILMLGSSITSTTNDHVETTVENRKIHLDGSNVVTVDGSAAELSTDPDAPTVLENPSWIHLEGNVAGADVGYYFPEDITLSAMKDTRTGDWAAQGTTTGTATNTYATFYVDHGVKPVDAGYAYVLLPGRSADETAAYAEAPDIEILQNDGAIHAARDNSQNILAANFWTAGAIEKLSVSAPASVIMQKTGDIVTIGVSDPTQRDVPITVTLLMPGEVISCDDTVTVEQEGSFLCFTVETTESLGGTHTLTFRTEEGADDNVELIGAVTGFDPITVEFGTPFYELELPEKAEFLASDGEQYELELNWSRGDYDSAAISEFTIYATPVLPEGICNSAEATVSLTIKTAGHEVLASADTYINDGTGANTNYSSNAALQVKVDNTSFYRKAILQFDLTDIPAGADSHTLVMTVSIDPYFQGGKVSQTDEEVDLTTVTWNSETVSDSSKWTQVATFTKDDAEDNILSINVTNAIEQALQDGKTQVTFMIEATGDRGTGAGAGKNQMSISSLESNVTQKPAIISESSGNRPANDKENLRFLLEEADELDGARFLNFDAEALAEAVTAGTAVYEDASATQEQVNDAEDALMRILLGLRLIPGSEGP